MNFDMVDFDFNQAVDKVRNAHLVNKNFIR